MAIEQDDIDRIALATAKAVAGQWLGSSGPALGTAVQSTHYAVQQLLSAPHAVTLTDAQITEIVSRLDDAAAERLIAAIRAQWAK